MLVQIAIILSAIALFFGCLFVIPGADDTSGIKGIIAFSSYSLFNVPITINQVLSLVSVLQVTLFLAATSNLLSRLAWFLIKRQGAPVAALDAPNRKIVQIVKLLVNRPSASVTFLSFLAIFAMVFGSIENVLLQRAVRNGANWKSGLSTVLLANTTAFNSSVLPIILYSIINLSAMDFDIDPSAIAPSHFRAGFEGFGDLISACNNITGICDPYGYINATSPLVNCGSSLDCIQDLDVFNDFASDCSTSYGQTPIRYISSNKGSGYISSQNDWLQSSIGNSSIAQKPGLDASYEFISSFVWNLTKIDPTVWHGGQFPVGTVFLANTTTVLCNVSSAWSVRTEHFTKGTVAKTIKHVYGLDFSTPPPGLQRERIMKNYTNERAESYLPVNDQNLTAAQESLHYLYNVVKAATGTCSGSTNVGDGLYRLVPFSCTNPFLQSFTASTVMNYNNSASLLNQEMNFVLERVAKRLISSTMDVTLPVSCSNCTYASTSYVEKVPFWSIVGTMNALSLLFGVGSLLIVAFGHIGDNDVNAALTIFTFGGDIGPENEFKKPIVAPAVSNNIRTGARNNRHYEMMERTSMGDKNTSDFGTFQ